MAFRENTKCTSRFRPICATVRDGGGPRLRGGCLPVTGIGERWWTGEKFWVRVCELFRGAMVACEGKTTASIRAWGLSGGEVIRTDKTQDVGCTF